MISDLLSNPWFLGPLTGLGGALLTVITQRVLGKRGLLTYNVWHNRIGMSAEDAVFGSVKVTWNNNVVANLYTSTIELRNESFVDYDAMEVRVFSSDTFLLTERVEIVGTTHLLAWTSEYAAVVFVPHGQNPTQAQLDHVNSRRDYVVPTMNRGQVVRFTYLNSAKGTNTPSIWLDVLHKGVKVEFRVPRQQVLGVPQPAAVVAGTLLGIGVLALVVRFVGTLWVAALVSMVYGLIVVIPGALLLRLWRWARDSIAG